MEVVDVTREGLKDDGTLALLVLMLFSSVRKPVIGYKNEPPFLIWDIVLLRVRNDILGESFFLF